MKFTRKVYGNSRFWDAPREGEEFLRINVNLSGQYILYRCYGLAENGITPLRSDRIASATTLHACKQKAAALFEVKSIVCPTSDLSHIRLPYKD